MKTIGIIGGMSWQSSQEYYKVINETIQERLGGVHNAKIILYSFDFDEIDQRRRLERWEELGFMMADSAVKLEKAGADIILLASNTAHKLASYVTAATKLPLLHIADATALKIQRDGLSKVGLLGTRPTMEESFYKDRLIKQFGLTVLIPNGSEREIIHEIIFEELCCGVVLEESRTKYLNIISSLKRSGAEGIILGCTELELIITQDQCNIPLYPTAKIHAQAVVDMALDNMSI